MELDEGLKLALDGRALLFVGAGFSRGATNLSGNDFSVGADLSATLSKEAGQPENLALDDDAAELYVEKFGVAKLVDSLKSTFSAKTVADSHKQIADVPWRRIYTTNYDDVLELACVEIGKRVDSVTPLNDSSQVSKKNLLCVHLNGFIRSTTQDSVWNDLKLTQHSYDSGSGLDSDWGTLFRADLQAAQAVFFVGYSLYDLDVRRLLFEEQLIDKTFFVLGTEPDLATAHRASKYGLLIAAGTAEFASQLSNFRKTYVPAGDASPISFCLVSYEFAVAPVSMEDRSVFDLLLIGRLRQDLVSASSLGQVKYCGPRKANDIALARIQSGTKIVIFHSMLGNGKTISIETMKYLAHSSGYKVFSLVRRGDSLAEELQNALLSPVKKIFFIDNYVEWLDVLPMFGAHRSEDYAVVMSARSSSNDVLVDRVAEEMATGDIIEVPVDKLADEDLEWIIDFFDEFGIWGDRASLSNRSKLSFLRETCHSEWQEILLSVLESPQILDKLQTLFSALSKIGVYRDPLVRMLILTVLAYMPDTSILVDLCSDRILETGFRKDVAARELVEFGTTSVGVRSSVTAGVLLRQVVDPTEY